MKNSFKLFTLFIVCSLVAIVFLQNDDSALKDSISNEQESLLDADTKKTSTPSNMNFLESSWSKVRQSITSIKNSLPTMASVQSQNAEQNPTKSNESNINSENDFSSNRMPLTNSEIQSVQSMTKALSRAIAQNLSSQQFMQMVNDSLKLRPQFLDEGTSSIGSLVTVRTHDALEGTRYLHAQFTGEKDKADFLQHASFQIRASPDSFNKAIEALNEVLPKDKKIKESSDDYILYSTGDGYVAWIKVANMDDLKSNDYNTATAKDLGTVIVTIEQEIHGDEEHKH